MQALDVHEQMPRGDAERRTRAVARGRVVMDERFGDGWIDDVQVRAFEPQLARAIAQPLAVERDRRRTAIRAREEIRTDAPGPVVPDLGAIERQHQRLAETRRDA